MESLKDVLARAGVAPRQENPPSLSSVSDRPAGCWCGGKGGRLREIIPFRGKDKAIEVWREHCTCPEGVAAKEYRTTQLRRKYEEDSTHAKVIAWVECEIPLRFLNYRLSTSPVNATQPLVVARLTPPVVPQCSDDDDPDHNRQWEEWRVKDGLWGGTTGSWFLWGGYGTGKTGLAVGYIYEWIKSTWGDESDAPVVFRSVPRMMTELRATYNRERDSETPTEEQLLKQFTEASLLVLDDLGAEQVRNTGWLEDRLYQIIGERHDNERPTIFTSNLSLEELAARIGERVTWRIVEMCGKDRIIHVEGPNLRL